MEQWNTTTGADDEAIYLDEDGSLTDDVAKTGSEVVVTYAYHDFDENGFIGFHGVEATIDERPVELDDGLWSRMRQELSEAIYETQLEKEHRWAVAHDFR